MAFFLLFILGLLIGSFLNVVSLRYVEGKPILGRHILGGRSHCRTCKEELHWFELIPLLSFIIQRGKCRHCYHTISWQYPIVETITGFVTASVPLFFYSHFQIQQAVLQGESYAWFYIFSGLWLLASYTLIVSSAIDFRLKILPDQANIFLAVIGALMIVVKQMSIENFSNQGSFLSYYATIFGQSSSWLTNLILALVTAVILFGGIILISRGRGMGMGDLKLALAIAFLLSWPDALIAYCSAFIIGSVVGLFLLLRGRKQFKDAVPFGPYLAIGVFVAMLYSEPVLHWYFGLAQ